MTTKTVAPSFRTPFAQRSGDHLPALHGRTAMKTLLLLSSAIVLRGQSPDVPRISRLLIASDIVLISTDIGDLLSSRGLYETNAALGRGPFGARQATISLGLTAVIVLAELPLARRWPRLAKIFAVTNFGAGVGVHGYEMIHNSRLERR